MRLFLRPKICFSQLGSRVAVCGRPAPGGAEREEEHEGEHEEVDIEGRMPAEEEMHPVSNSPPSSRWCVRPRHQQEACTLGRDAHGSELQGRGRLNEGDGGSVLPERRRGGREDGGVV